MGEHGGAQQINADSGFNYRRLGGNGLFSGLDDIYQSKDVPCPPL